MYTELLNSVVYDYLTQVDPKLAKKFKKEANVPEQLPPGSPGIAEIVKHFNETATKKIKRKLKLDVEENLLAAPINEEPVEAVTGKKSKKAKKDLAPAAAEKVEESVIEVVTEKKAKKAKKAKKN
eukprot:GFUD01054949.1.p1 GENE.GFUD01054949.1~~GFUD01054949.1.p1  ORF type:complete len:125 (-),score=56.41 GFUD01054949.1:146-520(-)